MAKKSKSSAAVNSQYLKWFHQIEKSLWAFFALFDDLCGCCARQTLDESASGRRKNWDHWCCCMIDNQVHDNWAALNPIQSRFDRGWYETLQDSQSLRKLGRGPCPALGTDGCRIRKCRPITCTTQLCSKMLVVLKSHDLIRKPTQSALQIEDLITLPDILPELYGIRQSRKVTRADVDTYIAAVKRFGEQFVAAQRPSGKH